MTYRSIVIDLQTGYKQATHVMNRVLQIERGPSDATL